MAKPSKSKVKMSPEMAAVITPEVIEKAEAELVKGMPKKRSQAWKGLEYAIGTAFRLAGFKKAKRYPKQDQLMAASQGRELPDLNLPEAPFIQVDGKHSGQPEDKGWKKVETLFLKCRAKYELKPEDRFAMVTQQKGSPHKIAHMSLEWFAELCAKAYLGGTSSDQWVCPSCKNPTLETTPAALNQEVHVCKTCTLQFITPKGTRPEAGG